MKTFLAARLSAMMFMEYFIWGVWYVTLGTYLTSIGFQGNEVGNALSTLAWAAIISAFFVSLIADKYFPAEKITGVLHILGGILMYIVSTIQSPILFFFVLLAYAICYSPTLALTTTIGMQHCPEPARHFPKIRVFGTIGWIAAGLSISIFNIENGPEPMLVAAVFSILLGIYSFTLPNTPPKAKGEKHSFRDIIGLDALKLMKDKSFAVLSLSALLITLPFAMYHTFTNIFLNEIGMINVAGKMTLAQMSEVVFMMLIPLLFIKLGTKKILLMGMVAWIIRYSLYAIGSDGSMVLLLYIGILLHGVAFDFFYVTSQIYMDKKAPVGLRTSVQGFFTFLTYGVGWLIGSYLTGTILQLYQVTDKNSVITGHYWGKVMLVPACIALVVTLIFMLFFSDKNGIKRRNMK